MKKDLYVDAEIFNDVVAELQRTNEELEKFAYVASHDLKAPLRAIANLANWVEEDITDNNITEETTSHLKLLKNRICRMEKLLDDLLLYARVGGRDNTFEEVDILQLIQNITSMLPSEKFEIVAETNITHFFAERFALELVLRNLISNSIKHHNKKRGKIEITITDKDKYIEFVVTDDGPGIKPEQYKEAFEMFKTFKPRDEVEGSGMGLALVKKVVENQGYTVDILSTNKGLSIRFNWKKFNNYRE